MARLPRFVLPGQPQHVIQRGNNRTSIFCCPDDYRFFLDTLKAGADRHQIDIHAYVLMTNHIHLLLTLHTEREIGQLMQHVGRYYVQYFNHQYQRTGTLWEGRYKATLIEAETYLMTCYRYIELNPVRAAMVADPGDYRWSSYRANALGLADTLITPHPLYRQLAPNTGQRRAAYRDLFDVVTPEREIQAIRDATNKAWVLGSDRFKNEIEQRLNRRARPKERGGDRRSEIYQQRQPHTNRVDPLMPLDAGAGSGR